MDYWLKQTKDAPLFPDLDWEKPEQRDQRGRLLIIGGNVHSFAAPAQAFSEALANETGYVRVVMPDALKKTMQRVLSEVEYASSTPSGSFALKSLESMLWQIQWASGILLPGDLGRNSETAIMLEKLARSTTLPLVLTRDALDYFTTNPSAIKERANTLIVASFAQVQKLATSLGHKHPLTFEMPLTGLVEALHELTSTFPFFCITKIHATYICAVNGKVVTSSTDDETDIWRLRQSARAASLWLQHPTKPLEAFAVSLL